MWRNQILIATLDSIPRELKIVQNKDKHPV